MNYRKAMFSDIDDISYLVTDLLGTCNINKNNISVLCFFNPLCFGKYTDNISGISLYNSLRFLQNIC